MEVVDINTLKYYSKTNVNYYKLANDVNIINTWKYITNKTELNTTIKTSKIIRLENLLWRQWYKLHFKLNETNFNTGID
jgi:sugar diacid utilization regulator